MTAFYNEIDPYAAEWLRNLIAAGHIAPGVVDERDIRDIRPDELAGYTQCHFFAGIGVWSYALRLGGWDDDTPVWTGSCPCQPFSSAGRRGGVADERHLWPHWFHLISQCRPTVVFGEQVASKDGLAWLDLVQADLEGLDYAGGPVPFPSAGVGAPHIRDRQFWVAEGLDDAAGARQFAARQGPEGEARHEARLRGSECGRPGVRLADAGATRLEGRDAGAMGHERPAVERSGAPSGLADSDGRHPGAEGLQRGGQHGQQPQDGRSGFVGRIERPGPVNGFWRDADWLFCTDGKWRPVEPGTFPLAHGVANRVGRLRAYGNAINAEAAAQFIAAYLDLGRFAGLNVET